MENSKNQKKEERSIFVDRLFAAWKVLRSDEYFVLTKKHCRVSKQILAGLDLTRELTREVIDMNANFGYDGDLSK